jgi:hypothetical protein
MLSADGVLLVTVPAGAGAPASLTVEPADVASLKPTFAGLEVIAAYELGPDGSGFAVPVAIEADLTLLPELTRDETALLWASEGGEYELAARQVTIDAGPHGGYALRGELSHFSTVVITRNPRLQVSFTTDDFFNVGDQVPATGRAVATADSTAQALVLVERATPHNALAAGEQARDFGSIDGGAQTIDRTFDPFSCRKPGIGIFSLAAEFTGFTEIRGGRRSRAQDITRRGEKRVFCHAPNGTDTVGGAGTGEPLQSITVAPATVDKMVGESFVLEIQIAGRTGDQGIALTTFIPNVISDARAANPRTVGNVTAVREFDLAGANFTLGGTGGIRVEYSCVRAGETGVEAHATYGRFLDGTARVTCRPPPPGEREGR